MKHHVGVVVAVALLAACGTGGSAQTLTGSGSGACDWTAVATSTASVTYPRACEWASGPAIEIEPMKAQCAGSDPAAVVRTTCPSTGGNGLVGCCTYPWSDLLLTWCYYDAALYAGRETRCRSTTINGDPAVWTTTVP